jgi:tryptophanyl-tRNA synthetase
VDARESKRTKADSGAVVTEEQAAEFAAKAAAEGRPRLRILTGDRTTGKLHIGHYVGSLKHRVKYQSLYDTFILMADVQALTTHYDRPEILKQSVREVALDYLASGLDPYTGGPDDGSKPKIVVQSMVPAIAELTVYYGLLTPIRSLIDNPTVKTEAEQHGFDLEERASTVPALPDTVAAQLGLRLAEAFPEVGGVRPEALAEAMQELTEHLSDAELVRLGVPALLKDGERMIDVNAPEALKFIRDELIRSKRSRGFAAVTYGFLGYPVSQAADITFVGAHLVPVGPDQVPLIELCREVVHRFNSQYGKRKRVLTTPNALLGVREALQGIDGQAKMSKSLDNAIYLSDTDEQIWARVKPAPTDPQRVRITDPGRPELCNIFSYHKVFCGEKEATIDEQALGVATVPEVAQNCSGAKWGCIECKRHLCKKLTAVLDPMRERRAAWESRPSDVEDILRAGTARANEEGQKTLEKVRAAMHMDYFSS